MQPEETTPSRPSMRSLAYGFYLVVGVIALCAVLAGYLTENLWLPTVILGLCCFLAAFAAIFTVLALFDGIDWKLVVLLVSPLILGFLLFGLERGDYWVGSIISYAIVTLALSLWHFLGEFRKRAAARAEMEKLFEDLREIRTAKRTDTHK